MPRAPVALLAVGLLAAPLSLAAQQRRDTRQTPAPRPRRAPASVARVPTPKWVLGFEPGEDRRLADWPALLRYYQALAKTSDRVRYRELGKSTLGAPFVALLISSPQNLKSLDRYRQLNARLADPRTIRNNREAQEALRDGRAIVLITSGIHSNEVGGHLTPAILAYRLASDTTAATRTILDNVILLLVPSLNPDGVSIVTRWYNRTLGTPAEGTDPPELYHHYTGHDNNRDWYAFTQVETQLVVDSLHNVWHPEIVHDIHQQDSDGSRLFLPPYLDPVEPNVDPLLVDGVNALGASVAWQLAGEGKPGIAINAIYDAWTPARAYQHYHGGVRILSEAASANLASPIEVPFDHLATRARGFNPRERSWNFTNPWPGGRWTLRDIVGYQTDAAYALLENAARYRDVWLANFLTVESREVRGWRGWPYAYGSPRQPRDTLGLTTLLGTPPRGALRPGPSTPMQRPAAAPGSAGVAGADGPRVGLYRSYDAAIDEGWTRWVFDTWRVPYVSVVDSEVRAGKLAERFDVVVLPDQSPDELLTGLPRAYPAPYPGGLGDDGVKALRQFVQDGGTLVALNDASRFAATQLLLPVRNVLEGVADDEFYAPGSIFRLELDTGHPVARGMPAQSIAWYE